MDGTGGQPAAPFFFALSHFRHGSSGSLTHVFAFHSPLPHHVGAKGIRAALGELV